jgi:hypothetical protein
VPFFWLKYKCSNENNIASYLKLIFVSFGWLSLLDIAVLHLVFKDKEDLFSYDENLFS